MSDFGRSHLNALATESSFMEDSSGDLFSADSPKGISLIENGRLIPVNEELRVLGMVESPQHDLWFSGVIRVRRDDLRRSMSDREAPLDYELIDRADGLNSLQCSVGAPNLAITPDNKLWIATVKGLAMLDLAQPPGGSPKPKVFVGMITVGKDRKLAGGEAILPPGTPSRGTPSGGGGPRFTGKSSPAIPVGRG